MKRGRLLISAILFLLCALALGGCSAGTPGETGADITVRVVATRDFSQEIMFDEALGVPPGTSAMAALKQVAEVETAYGGGFVSAINGVGSEHGRDWFIFVNGMAANAGALDYTLHDGDIQHWDFHDWSFRMAIPASIGDFPDPLVHGYQGEVSPTVIAYEEGLEDSAQALQTSLKGLGVASVSTENVSGLTESDKRHSNLILIGTMDCDLVAELNQVWDRLGFFVHFEDGVMVSYDSEGEVTVEYGSGCGVIQASQSPWNPNGIGVCENVVWMVSGTDKAGVESAVDALTNRHDEFKYAYAV
ncbi:MAG: DUF4430 domain-containing protein, partial [Dehalococcoidia bacterium]